LALLAHKVQMVHREILVTLALMDHKDLQEAKVSMVVLEHVVLLEVLVPQDYKALVASEDLLVHRVTLA